MCVVLQRPEWDKNRKKDTFFSTSSLIIEESLEAFKSISLDLMCKWQSGLASNWPRLMQDRIVMEAITLCPVLLGLTRTKEWPQMGDF